SSRAFVWSSTAVSMSAMVVPIRQKLRSNRLPRAVCREIVTREPPEYTVPLRRDALPSEPRSGGLKLSAARERAGQQALEPGDQVGFALPEQLLVKGFRQEPRVVVPVRRAGHAPRRHRLDHAHAEELVPGRAHHNVALPEQPAVLLL